VISGFWAGLGGGLYCFLTQSVFASMLDWVRSGDALIATVLGGGLTSFYGPIIGSIALIVGQELISSFWTHWRLVFGLGFVIIILVFAGRLHARMGRERL
jgi:branched-chain amino acid transport system permease protein